jgi:predicted pyridoxine 5'-phosphate oxidase superfamily flavin-nucleotide-binding protein
MTHQFSRIAFTPAVKSAQERAGSRASYERFAARGPRNDRLGDEEISFLASRDSFYLATVSETGWPYVQHRGGAPGFVAVLDDRTIAFADVRGNRQYVTVGNLAGNDRMALIFMDYPNRRRLKMLGRARMVKRDDDPALLTHLQPADRDVRVERGIVITIEAFDWNCPQHITPRYTEAEIAAAVAPLRRRLAEVEAEVARLRSERMPPGR